MQRQTVLLVFGGESSEHEVSISSAHNVYAAIDNEKYEVILGYIDRQGKWWLLDQLERGDISTHGRSQLVPVLGSGCFMTVPDSVMVKPDVILPILHGKNGEDGSLAGLGQLLHLPVVGCDMTAGSICMDKLATKEILASHDIQTVPYQTHRVGQDEPSFNKLTMSLGSPLFVKPTRSGSSVGVSKVHTEEELSLALDEAHQHDAMAIIERDISGRELEVAVLGNPPDHEVSGVGEIASGEEFYSYQAKYSTSSKSSVTVPADIADEVAEDVRHLAGQVYQLLGCKGLARIDFFLNSDGSIYVNEVNTMPGFTNISMYPKLWRQQGTSYPELIERLLLLALDDNQLVKNDSLG